MAIKATLSRTWIRRQIIIGSVAFALGLWFFFDGAVTYPARNIQYHAYRQLVEQGNEAAWPAYAHDHHWPQTPPEKEYRILDQWVLGSLSMVGSIAAFALLAGSWRRCVSSDGDTVTATNGTRVPIAAIRSTDRRKWQSKGIAYAIYEQGGKSDRLTLDDFKYEGVEKILLQVEESIAARPPQG
ncbi:MAG: hypothetical protein QM796_11875 [Chthoniobacteraceae bacterium]